MTIDIDDYDSTSGEQNHTIQGEILQVSRDKNIELTHKNIGMNPRLEIS